MRWRIRPDATWLRRWTKRTGVAALVVLLLPVLTIFAMISVIGIPIALVLMAIPPLFTVLAVASLVQRLLRSDGPPAVLASIAIAVLLLHGVSLMVNAGLDRRAREFLAEDSDTLERPLRARSIGLARFSPGYFSQRESRCGELCQRLLLSGTVERVLVADRKAGADAGSKAPAKSDGETADPWTPETPAFVYRLEQRESCPPTQVSEQRAGNSVDDAKPADAMRLAIASGRCLLEETSTLGEADAVVTIGPLHRGQNDFGAGLSLFADTIFADRASVHVRENGRFVERYRWTGVLVYLHPFVPVPTLIGGPELRMEPGFLRNTERRNTRPFAGQDPHPVLFARDELGLDVSLPATATEAEVRASLIARGLDRPGPVDTALQQVIQDFFASLTPIPRPKAIDEPSRQLAFRILADPRVTAPRDTWAIVRACEKAGDAVNGELAGILFRKLATTDRVQREDHPSYLGWPASYLANAIAMLPPQAILPHRRELEAIARDRAQRRRALRALDTLKVLGAEAVPTLLFLVEDAGDLRKQQEESKRDGRDSEEWRDVYVTGLRGLCSLGPEASAALVPLTKQLWAGELAVEGSAGELLLTTLIRLGADPAELRTPFGAGTSEDAGKSFDRNVSRAKLQRADCTY